MKNAVVIKGSEAEELNVTGAQVKFLCPAEVTGNNWSLSEIKIPKQAGPPVHTHPWEEGYYIVEGEVGFTVGEKKVIAMPGDFIFVPADLPHSFHGLSDKGSRVIVFDRPAAAEAFFKDVQREVKWPQEAYKMAEIGARHKIQFFHGEH